MDEPGAQMAAPMPVPRPRHLQQRNIPATGSLYPRLPDLPTDQVTVKPVPAPRRTKNLIIEDDPSSGDGRYENVILRTSRTPPPPPPPAAATTAAPTQCHSPVLSPAACRQRHSPAVDSDNVSTGSADSEGPRKYKTNSPSELFKSIGSTSKLLTESIGERVAYKTTKVTNNVRNIVKWSQETGKSTAARLKTVGRSGNHQPPAASASAPVPDGADPRQTMPPEMAAELMQKIHFHSPLEEDEAAGEPPLGATYDVPKNKPTNLSSGSKSDSNASLTSAASSGSGNRGRTLFTRNNVFSQSLYSKVIPKWNRDRPAYDGPDPGPLVRQKNKSESNLQETKFYVDMPPLGEESQGGGRPVPESVYGKLRPIRRSPSTSSGDVSEEDNTLPELSLRTGRRRKSPNDGRIFSRPTSSIDELPSNFRSDSWNFYDSSERSGQQLVTPPAELAATADEPDTAAMPIYGKMCEMETWLLKPTPPDLVVRHSYDEVSIRDIIDEFDPLASQSLDDIIAMSCGPGVNELTLIESILGAESYHQPRRVQVGVPAVPVPPQRGDSLLESPPTRHLPALPKRKKERPERKESMIIHQNLALPSDSIENLVDEAIIEPYLAVKDEPAAIPAAEVDLSYPGTSQSQWYLANQQGHAKPAIPTEGMAADPGINANLDNPAPVKKCQEKPVELPAVGSEATVVGVSSGDDDDDDILPTYLEAVGDSLFTSGADATPAPPTLPSTSKPSVAAKLFNALKRKPSLKATKNDTKTVLEMIPKPEQSNRLVTHKGHVLRFPSGKIGDVLNELAPRSIVLRERILQTYLDPQQTQPKESIHLKNILSLQCIAQHKFNGDGRLDLHCFEVVLAVPKNQPTTNPNLVVTSSNSGNAKSIRQSYMFGTHKLSDRNVWMAKIFQSVTDAFPEMLLAEFLRAGWCYLKKSVSSEWTGAWILLAKRKLHFFNNTDRKLEELDLRKVRCIGMKDDDHSIHNLHVEGGSHLLIDCPPYSTLYFIMSSPRETQIWRKVITVAARKNGTTLSSQQLTADNVPVLIDKCINFIYAYGSMSEGIYRKSGSTSAVNKILQLFAEDAFAVQLTRKQYNEHDVAAALKKFVRELPGTFFGGIAGALECVLSFTNVDERIGVYQELLMQLPRIEYRTLRKLLGHLSFVATLERYNKMSIPNLALIWGPTLIGRCNSSEGGDYAYLDQDGNIVADMIRQYRRIFTVTEDEERKDQLLLAVLKKYHAAAENLSNEVKHSGDLKIWITIDCDEERTLREDKLQVNVDVTPAKVASDICKELAAKAGHPWHRLTLYEVIANGNLVRPIHSTDKVLEIVVRWTYWEEADRKNNYLVVKPTTILNEMYRLRKCTSILAPKMELKFADRKTKALRNYLLQVVGRTLVVLKKQEKRDKGYEEILKIDLESVTPYIGCESKRDRSCVQWVITLVENDFKKRTREAPFIGHVLGGERYSDHILWLTSIYRYRFRLDTEPEDTHSS